MNTRMRFFSLLTILTLVLTAFPAMADQVLYNNGPIDDDTDAWTINSGFVVSFGGPNLSAGTYWVNLQNAVVNTGDPVYWDENSGEGCTSPGCPSQASENSFGTIPSESFTILGNTGTSTVPEPSTLILFTWGIVGIAGLLRRRYLHPQERI